MLSYKIKTIDNFLDNDDFNDLCELSKNLFINKEKNFNIFHNEINDNKILTSSIDKNLLTRIHKKYYPKAINILNDLCPEKIKLYDYSDFTIIITNKESKFPIHDDTPNKLLSGVVYLMPEINTGTNFYSDKKGRNKTNIEWKSNRAVFFSRKERETWHSYEGDGKNDRIALVYNLMTNKIREVFNIEKKNYFIGNMRYKINPYIYHYFKKTL